MQPRKKETNREATIAGSIGFVVAHCQNLPIPPMYKDATNSNFTSHSTETTRVVPRQIAKPDQKKKNLQKPEHWAKTTIEIPI